MTPTPDSIALVKELQEMSSDAKASASLGERTAMWKLRMFEERLRNAFPTLAKSFLHLSEENTRLEEKLAKCEAALERGEELIESGLPIDALTAYRMLASINEQALSAIRSQS